MIPLHISAQAGFSDITAYLVKSGAFIDVLNTKSGFTPLYLASHQGQLEVVKLLIRNSANINLPRNNGATPLYIAANHGHNDVVKYLLTNGAQPIFNIKKSPLHIAAFNGHSRTVQILPDRLVLVGMGFVLIRTYQCQQLSLWA